MRRLVVGVACALLVCASATTGLADEFSATPSSSNELGVSPTGMIGATRARSPAGAVAPLPSTFPGAFDQHADAPPVPPVEEAAPVEGVPVEPPPVEAPIVELPPIEAPPVEVYEIPCEPIAAPMPVAPAPRLERRPPPPSDCSPECGQARDDCCWPVDDCGKRYGCTTITLEGSFGLLNDPQGVLGTPAFGFTNQFDWDELDYGGAIGGRVTLEHAVAPQEWVQVRGAYYGSWDDSAGRVGVFGFQPGNTFTGGGTQRVGVTNDVFGTLTSEADFWGAEINYADELSCSGCTRWDLILGVRYLQFNETARAAFNAAPIPGFTGPAFAASDVENLFIGLQVGARWHYQPSQNFEITASLKVLGGNVNRQAAVSDRSIFAGGLHAASSDEDEIVLGADIEIGARLRLSRTFAITAGYNLVFLDNILRANDAMDFSASGSGAVQAVQDTDQLFWHGVFAGLQLNF